MSKIHSFTGTAQESGNKTLIVIGGVPGAGKTWYRTHQQELKDLPCVDIADVYMDHPMRSDDFTTIYSYFVKRLVNLLKTNDTVVGEGAFLPHSLTRGWLVADCKYAGITVKFIECHASLRTCATRIEQSGDRVKLRTEMLKSLWPRAANFYFDESGRDYVYST